MAKYVQLSNGDMFIIFKNADGSEYYLNKEGKKRKLRKDQKVIAGPDDVVPGASTDSDLFRVSLPPVQAVWDANKGIDKYTGFSQKKTEDFEFKDLSQIVKDYDHFKKERAIKVERDHTVEIQMVSRAWDRVKGKQPSTRSNVKCIRESVNHLDNLNCTPGVVNMKKESAVKSFLRYYDSGDGNGLRLHLIDYGVGPNTTRRICTTYEDAAYKISDKVTKVGTEVHDDFADEIKSMIGHMKLD